MKVKILTMNIGNPSLERAQRQCQWLENQDCDILILTETKNSQGCHYIYEYFFNKGGDLFTLDSPKRYDVAFPLSNTGDLGVMLISKYEINNTKYYFDQKSRFYSRQAKSSIEIENKCFFFNSIYVPSRDKSDDKIQRKKEFLEYLKNEIRKQPSCKSLIAGDFNLLDKHHIPHYSSFFKWEYDFYDFMIENQYVDAYRLSNPQKQDHSWYGRTGDGYRYDYIFVSSDMAKDIIRCDFLHESRLNKLTDHSALYLEINI